MSGYRNNSGQLLADKRISYRLGCGVNGRGTVLIVTMWIVIVLAGLALVFARSMRVEAIATANYVSNIQADQLAQAGLQYALYQVANSGSTDTVLIEQSGSHEGYELDSGYFWFLQANFEEDRNYSYGLTDEGGKININSATQEVLEKLPGMTSELAASIIDWRDDSSEDGGADTVTPGGAESEYYLLLPEPYYCKDDEFETVEELLMVKGASEEILYGEDYNRNGVLDDNENDGDTSFPPDNANGRLDRGIYDYVTVFSECSNKDADGNDRLNIADVDRTTLGNSLEEYLPGKGTQIASAFFTSDPDDDINIFDLYDACQDDMDVDDFKEIADHITTSNSSTLKGMININTAPREVLLCLEGLDETDVDALISERERLSEDDLATVAWILDVIDVDKATLFGGLITTSPSLRQGADIVGVSRDGRAYSRYKAVIDSSVSPARVIYWKSLKHLGWPLEPTYIDQLRHGKEL